MTSGKEKFGEFVRRGREAKEIGLREMAKVIGGYQPLEGSIGVLPVVDDTSPTTKAFVERFGKAFPGRTPSSEVSLNYTAVHATALAMKLAGSTTDATAIRANLDKAMKALPDAQNPHGLDGVDDKGGSLANTRVAVVDGGKVKERAIRDFR